jgi:hypothetical protein
MVNIGIIAEGDTDFVALQNILIGYFDKDVTGYINQLQPKRGQMGGWSRVLNYCETTNFKNDFVDNDFMVIQVDTDKSFELPFDVAHEQNGKKLSVQELIENVKERFKKSFESAFGVDFFPNHSHRILFAIAVHETECWLLPLHYLKEKEGGSIKNCYETLNKKVKGLQKTYKIYDALSDDFTTPKKLEKASQANPSFKIFIENELKIKIPQNTEGV